MSNQVEKLKVIKIPHYLKEIVTHRKNKEDWHLITHYEKNFKKSKS